MPWHPQMFLNLLKILVFALLFWKWAPNWGHGLVERKMPLAFRLGLHCGTTQWIMSVMKVYCVSKVNILGWEGAHSVWHLAQITVTFFGIQLGVIKCSTYVGLQYRLSNMLHLLKVYVIHLIKFCCHVIHVQMFCHVKGSKFMIFDMLLQFHSVHRGHNLFILGILYVGKWKVLPRYKYQYSRFHFFPQA